LASAFEAARLDAAADVAKEAITDTLSASSEEAKGHKRSREQSTRRATKKVKELTTLSGEDRQRLRSKFDSIVKRANNNEALRNGLESVIRIAQHMRAAVHKGKRKAGQQEFDLAPLKTAWDETKKIIAKFGFSADSLDKFTEDVTTFYTEISGSKPLSELFSEIGTIVMDTVKNPSILTQGDFTSRFEGLTDRLRSAWTDLKSQDAFSRAYDTLSSFVTEYGKNPALAVASKAREVLGTTLFDEKGNFALKGEMLGKVRELFVKLLVAQLKALPLPKVEGSNDTYDYCFEEMNMNLAETLPDQIHLTMKNDMDIDVATASANEMRGKLVLTAQNIKPSLTNVKFWFKRKGLVSIEDHGKADVHLTGEGATITIRLDMDMNDFSESKHLFRVTDVFCVIDNLKIMVVEAEKHETLLSWLAPIISGRVKSMLEERIVTSIRDSVERIEEGLSKAIDLAPSMEQMKQGMAIIAHPIAEGIPAAAALIKGSGTTQG